MPEFTLISALLGAACFTALSVLLFVNSNGSGIARALTAASSISALWLGLLVAYSQGLFPRFGLVTQWLIEILRDLAWMLVLDIILQTGREEGAVLRFRRVRGLALGTACLAAYGLMSSPVEWLDLQAEYLSKSLLGPFLLFAILGLIGVEQLYRNSHPDRRWSIKFLCLGIGAIFAYDFVLYADALLFNRLNAELWAGRGAANAVAVPLIGIAAARNKKWQLNLFLSRKVVFHSTALLGVGLYLLAMAAAGYVLRAYGGEWGSALRVVFLFAAMVLLISLVGSAGVRSRLRIFLARHFYRNKYDYGEVWLSFTNRLSQSDAEPARLHDTMVRAIADIVDATGGVMWARSVTGNFAIVANWEMPRERLQDISEDHALLAALKTGQIIDIRTVAALASTHEQARVPTWLLELPRAWLLVPIIHRDELLAFVLLGETRSNARLSWEDETLLGTIGRQSAGYLALLRATEELSDARQFEAFNRLSAFLVHDLKNVVAQLSLVLRNSERHRENPEFISDAFNTIGDAVARMNRMLSGLRQAHTGPTDSLVIQDIANEVLGRVAHRKPVPSLQVPAESLRVLGSRDRLIAVLEHLLQNAQDATTENGTIAVRIARAGADRMAVEIADSGCGMTQEFIQNRLFKPFDTTKGKGGMGIGVYESLHIVTSIGGRMTVESTPGGGTTFTLLLPLLGSLDHIQMVPRALEKSA